MDKSKMNYIYELEYQNIGYDLRNAKPHREDCIEMLQFWSKGGYFIVRNHIFPITPGTLLIVNAMETHYSNPSNVDTYNRSRRSWPMRCSRRPSSASPAAIRI